MHESALPKLVILFARALFFTVLLSTGCGYFDRLKGTGFGGTRAPVSGSVRTNADSAQPSGFFTDKRSDEIEKNLGGFE